MLDDPLSDGHYARKQLFSKARLIAWSHRSRFKHGLELLGAYQGKRILDFGCGDGTFLAMLAKTDGRPESAVGVEIADSLVQDCCKRFGDVPRTTFHLVADLKGEEWSGSFDAIVCMEVLEHVIDWTPLFKLWHRLLAPNGELLVSVPVETGPAVAVKQLARRLAGWRGIGDYPGMNPYTWGEYFQSLFAGSQQHIVRPIHGVGEGRHHCHKGFNWKVLRDALGEQFDPVEQSCSPLRWLPPGLNSQVWLRFRRRSE